MVEKVRDEATPIPPESPNDRDATMQTPFRIECTRYRAQEYVVETFARADDLPEFLGEDWVYWIHLTGIPDPATISYFGKRFGIHETHMEDIVQINRHARIHLSDAYLKSEHFLMERVDPSHRESVVLFLFRDALISFQKAHADMFSPIRGRLEQDGSKVRHLKAGYLYYLMIEHLVEEATLGLQELIFALDDMERLLLEENPLDMRRVYEIKKELLDVKSAVYPLRGLMILLTEERNQILDDQILPYIKHVEDHVEQTISEVGHAMDTIENMNQSNMTKLSNQMNSIMKVLTIFSAIFIPLNFLTGMYGMNFRYMPFLRHPYAFYGFLLASIVIVTGLISYFKRRHWY